ncbi:type 1 glutamine amidotransferase [Gorillibacterium timonense]|uniref:type 1 glutamine amidotransferase n=1 Tax=Gorillibacterium timonense TaxID=1689269 RepID=UPI00071E329C|nr:type 1 glutamine amidotransferase [Gorillibacterium timonense]
MRLHYLQHIELESPGSILHWAESHGHSVTRTLFSAGESLPDQTDFDWLVIMGGPMNIYEEEHYPWLSAEKAFIREAIDLAKPVLGICLGSQLIADVIGGRVTANPLPEIGWWPIVWTEDAQTNPLFSHFPATSVVFHWHYDTFSVLPPDAKILAASTACRQQAFSYRDHVFGFQFHLENTDELLKGYIEASPEVLSGGEYIQLPDEILAHPDDVTANQAWMDTFLSRLEEKFASKDKDQEGERDGACRL